jgi:hypothetical protein
MSSWRRDVAVALPPWLTARGLVAIALLIARAATDRLTPNHRPVALRNGLVAWDGTFYRDIAHLGYHRMSEGALRFFPAHALLGRVLDPVLPGGVTVALVVEANILALVAGALLHRLVLLDHGPDVARRATWLLALFPASFVLVLGYAEPLMLVGVIGSLVAARSHRWGWAIGLAFVAGLSRPLGVLVAVPLALGAIRDWRTERRFEPAAWAAVAAAPLALVAFLGWVERSFGDGMLPLRVQNQLRGDFVDPISRLIRGARDLTGAESFGDGLHFPFALAFVALAVIGFWVLRFELAAYGAVVVLVAVSADNLNSFERYGLNAFPLIIVLAVLARDERLELGLLTLSAALLSALATLAFVGAYVP